MEETKEQSEVKNQKKGKLRKGLLVVGILSVLGVFVGVNKNYFEKPAPSPISVMDSYKVTCGDSLKKDSVKVKVDTIKIKK